MTTSIVTGACGFIGRHLCDALANRGDKVIGIDVKGTSWRPEIELRHVDLRDPKAVTDALAGGDTVFHNASLVHTKMNRIQDVWDVNLSGTQHVIAGCRAHGIKRLVYVSSGSVVYDGQDIENGDERMPYAAGTQAPYAASKIEAEKAVLAANSPDLATCAIRPHVVFGPGDTRFLPAILARARAKRLNLGVGNGKHLSDFTYVDNLVDALLAADARLSPGSPVAGQAYFVTNGEPIPFFGFVGKVLDVLGLPPLRGSVPYWVAYGAATVAESWDTLRGGTLNTENGLSRFAIRYMCTHHYFAIDKARRDLGWSPAVSIDEGIRRTAAAL